MQHPDVAVMALFSAVIQTEITAGILAYAQACVWETSIWTYQGNYELNSW